MLGKITLEDHFAIEETLGDSQPFGAHVWTELRHRLLDFQDQRLRLMDEAGIAMMIVSLNAPAVQAIPDAAQAAALARQANDVAGRRGRQAFPIVSLGSRRCRWQDPALAARELERCVNQLGFKARSSRLLAERNARRRALLRPAAVPAVLEHRRSAGRSVLSASAQSAARERADLRWASLAARADLGVAAETAVHALRLIAAACSTRNPRSQDCPRPSRRRAALLSVAHRQPQRWMKAAHKYAARKSVADYVHDNFHLTTSGHFQHAGAHRCRGRIRRRPRSLLGRLPVRGPQRRRALVRWPAVERKPTGARSAAATP